MFLLFNYIKVIPYPSEMDFSKYETNFIITKYPTYADAKREPQGAHFIEESEIKYISGLYHNNKKDTGVWYIVTKDNMCWISRDRELFIKYQKYFKINLFKKEEDKDLISHIDITL